MFCDLGVLEKSRQTGFKVREIMLPVFAGFSVVNINSKSKRGSVGIKGPPPQDRKERRCKGGIKGL